MQFPIAQAYAQVRAADLDALDAAGLFDAGRTAAPRRTWPSSSPPRRAGRRPTPALDTHGGYGFADEYDVERKFRETRLYQVAPVNNNLVLAFVGQHVLGMPRSY